MSKIQLIKADITTLDVDAIVNAANKTLLGGGGVDGAIHKAAGEGLLRECMTLGGCETGQAKITKGYNLPCRYVIHTVGPIYSPSATGQDEQLAACYTSSLALAQKYGLKSVAFSAISTGVYGYPIERACAVAYDAVKKFLDKNSGIEKVIFVCFNDRVYDAYAKIMSDK